eukprot:TRINITY_DN431524_c0_g1_i1.p1 TRINITY_DN431524_c0_g1~~TRINITY_DN431524_c0_g1_i1.p1  ORF type:complete len:195 (-),score=42.36 TRINITY_DN431524_c0_g1_i1:835-1419(-)
MDLTNLQDLLKSLSSEETTLEKELNHLQRQYSKLDKEFENYLSKNEQTCTNTVNEVVPSQSAKGLIVQLEAEVESLNRQIKNVEKQAPTQASFEYLQLDEESNGFDISEETLMEKKTKLKELHNKAAKKISKLELEIEHSKMEERTIITQSKAMDGEVEALQVELLRTGGGFCLDISDSEDDKESVMDVNLDED